MKCMKSRYKNKEEINESNEVKALRRFAFNDNIIKLIEVLYDESTGHAAMVFELMNINLYEAIKGRKALLPEKKVKLWMFQVLKALDCIHRKGVFHRDIKPENILLKGDAVKLADFGSCKGIYGKHPFTEYISTRWYRSPECLITDGYYNFKMDIWGLGCVFFEILTLFPLFQGDNELDQIAQIHQVLGTPSDAVLNAMKRRSSNEAIDDIPFQKGYGIRRFLAHVSDECIDLITQMIKYNPNERLSASQALKHPYFRDLFEQDCCMLLDSNPIKQLNIGIGTGLNNDSMLLPGRIEDSMSMIQASNRKGKSKDKKETSFFPTIKENKKSKYYNSNSNERKSKVNEDMLLVTFGSKLPIIKQQQGNNNGNEFNYTIKNNGRNIMNNSNDFKKTLKHNISNQSIEVNAKSISTHYAKNYQYPTHNRPGMSMRMSIGMGMKHKSNSIFQSQYKYVSPYSLKIISNKVII